MSKRFNLYDKLIVIMIASASMGQLFQIVKVIGLFVAMFVLLYINSNALSDKNIKHIKYVLLAYIGFHLFGYVWTVDIDTWGKNMINLVSLCFLFLGVIVFSNLAKNPILSIKCGWMWLVLLTLPIAGYELLTNQHFSHLYEGESYIRGDTLVLKRFASVFYGNSNTYTTVLCLSLPFVMGLFQSRLGFVTRSLSLIALLGASFVTVLNVSRGGMLVLCILWFCFILYSFLSSKMKISAIIFSIVTVGLSVVFYDKLFYQFQQRLIAKGGLLEDSSRTWMFEKSLEVFKGNLFGISLGDMSYHYFKVQSGDLAIPHNMWMEFLLYSGIVFFPIFLWFIVKLFYCGILYTRNESRFIFISVSLMILPLSVINSGYFLIPVVWLFFGSLYVMLQKGNKL